LDTIPVFARAIAWTQHAALRALFATPGAVRMVECDAKMACVLPAWLEWDEFPPLPEIVIA